jgi:hypothetical protein
MQKKSIEERWVVVEPRLYLVGKRYDLWGTAGAPNLIVCRLLL